MRIIYLNNIYIIYIYMDKYCFSQFNEKFYDFIDKLNFIVNDDNINSLKKKYNKINQTKLIKNFVKNLETYKDSINKCDDSIFTNEIFIYDNINISNIWNKLTNETTKKSFWEYLQILYILGEVFVNGSTNNDMMKNLLETNNTSTSSNQQMNLENMLKNITGGKMGDINNKLFDVDENEIKEASNNMKEMFKDSDSKTGDIMCDMIGDISNELTNSKGKGLNNILNIAENVANKFKPKLESGEINLNDLLNSAKNAMGSMSGEVPDTDNPMDLLNNLMKNMK